MVKDYVSYEEGIMENNVFGCIEHRKALGLPIDNVFDIECKKASCYKRCPV